MSASGGLWVSDSRIDSRGMRTVLLVVLLREKLNRLLYFGISNLVSVQDIFKKCKCIRAEGVAVFPKDLCVRRQPSSQENVLNTHLDDHALTGISHLDADYYVLGQGQGASPSLSTRLGQQKARLGQACHQTRLAPVASATGPYYEAAVLRAFPPTSMYTTRRE
jgi:hypothetical protein